jgi:hypothetical protein
MAIWKFIFGICSRRCRHVEELGSASACFPDIPAYLI